MSYFQDSNYRPPLPPRSPHLGTAATPDPAFSPFPTPSLASDCGIPSPSYEIPPPLPRRPVGAPPGTATSAFGGPRSASASYLNPSGHGPGTPGFASFPPPPISPNRPQASHQQQKPPPLPPRSPLQVPNTSTQPVSGAYHAQVQVGTASNDRSSTPNQFTSFSLPPPGTPAKKVTSVGSHIQQDNGGIRSKFPLPPDHPLDPEIPSSPPPAYSMVAETGSQMQSPSSESLPHATYSSSEAPMTPGGSGATTPDPSTYMTFPSASFAPATRLPAISPQVVVSPASTAQRTSSGTSLQSSNVSNPQSPDAMSFFPTPPLVSPMPVKDPIEELMQSVSLDLKAASKESTRDSRLDQVQTPPPSSTASLAVSPSLGDSAVTPPLRPPKKPLDDSPTPVQQVNGAPRGGHQPSVSFEAAQVGTAAAVSRPRLRSHSFKAKAVVTSCIDTPSTFSTTWYSHPGTPGFLICSRCYADHISATKFANVFQSSMPNDGKPRVCRFSRPRFKDHMFPTAVATSYLQPLIDYMRRRSNIPDCHGADGILGSTAYATNIKWYNTKDDTIPGFLVCEACFEDYVGCSSSLSTFLQSHPQGQALTDTWACDFALSFIQRQYEADSKNANPQRGWDNFVTEAKARIGIPRCGQAQSVRTFGRKWFQPASGPKDLVFCAACYCDEVIHTGEEPKWTIVPGLTEARDTHIRCALGGRFNIKIAMARAQERKDFACFWDAVRKLEWHPPCEEAGVSDDAEWWTLPGNPDGFQVCGACYSVICKSLEVAHIFARKLEAPARTTNPPPCCFNVAHPRLRNYMPRLLELYFTNNPAALINYAEIYASIAPCARDEEVVGGSWYGWDDCHICPECYLEFAKHHELAEHMPLNNTWKGPAAMCEMWSPRMRQQFVVCSRRFPPDVGELLHTSRHRREVHDQTVPQMKRILRQQNPALSQQPGGQTEAFIGGMRLFKTLEQQWKEVE